VGGAGGSGRVVIRYNDGYQNAASVTGSTWSNTWTTGFKTYSFIGAGSITF
jgi:hypothetical protein